MVIDVGAQSTNLLILDGQRFWLRNLPIAGNSFTSMLEKRLNIPRAEAEKLKYTVADSRHRRRLLEVLRPVMRDLVAEIQRSVGYYKSLSQAVKFEEILVTGEGYKLFGLDRFLAEQLQYQITPIHELKNIVYQGDPARLKDLQQSLPSLGVAIGLGLQGLNRANATINLLAGKLRHPARTPVEAVQRPDRRRPDLGDRRLPLRRRETDPGEAGLDRRPRPAHARRRSPASTRI